MNKIVLILALLLLSCNSEKKSQKTDLEGIDSIRYKMAKTYKEGHVEIEDEFEAYSYVPCTSCELDFLLLLDGKSEITEEDVKNLLCIDNGCDDNAEFRQFYNEVLIKSFNKNPDLFSREVYGLTSQNYDSILTELQSPVNDEITASPENLNSYFINRIQ